MRRRSTTHRAGGTPTAAALPQGARRGPYSRETHSRLATSCWLWLLTKCSRQALHAGRETAQEIEAAAAHHHLPWQHVRHVGMGQQRCLLVCYHERCLLLAPLLPLLLLGSMLCLLPGHKEAQVDQHAWVEGLLALSLL